MKISGFLSLLQTLVFIVTYSEACNVTIVVTDVKITVPSPGYPQPKGESVNCWWIFASADADKLVGIRSDGNPFDKESVTNCSSYSLTFHNGRSSSAPYLYRTCSLGLGTTIVSAGNYVYLQLLTTTSNINYKRGFKLHIFQVEKACNITKVVTDVEIIVPSPGYPQPYGDYISCWGRFESSDADKLVGIKSDTYDIGVPVDCSAYSITIYDGMNSSAPLLTRKCSITMEPVVSSGRYIYVHFISNTSDAMYKQGLKLHIFQLERCGGELTATSERRYLTSPGFPYTYFINLNCTWRITAENETDTLWIHTDTAALQRHFKGFPCFRDVLTFYNGDEIGQGDTGLLGSFCGKLEVNVHSSKNVMTVNFHTDSTVTKVGFNLSYTAKQEDDCNMTMMVNNLPTFIYSPGYPDGYYNDLSCYMEFYSLTKNIKLEIISLDIEGPYPKCDKDALIVYTGSFENNTLRAFCGDSANGTVIYANTNQLFLKFTTDNDTVGSGYRIKVATDESTVHGTPEVEKAQPSCGEAFLTATSSPQYLQSPGYPTQYYNNEECGWMITASHTDMVVRIEVIDAEFGGGNLTSCQNYYVIVYDGLPTFGTPQSKLCSVSQRRVQSTGSRMTVKFHTDRTTNAYRGFKLSYFQTAEAICGGTINASTTAQSITSPNYPSDYRSYLPLFCIWRVYAPRNTNIQLTMSHFDVAPDFHGDCYMNYVTVYDGNGTSPYHANAGQLCGSEGRDYTSSENSMTVIYNTDGRTAYGFNFRIQAGDFRGCSQTAVKLLTTTNGTNKFLWSPNYPFSAPKNADCTWLIDTGDRHYYVSSGGDPVFLKNKDGCSRNYVEAFDGEDDSAPSLGRWCSSSQGFLLKSTGRYMFLKFKSDSSNNQARFTIQYSRQWHYVSDVNEGAVIGGIVGGVAFLMIIIFGIKIIYSRKRKTSGIPIIQDIKQ